MSRNAKIPANLVDTWIEASTDGGRTLADAVRDMARALARPIRQNRIYEWRLGNRTPPPEVLRYMARIASPWVMERTRDPMAIAEALTPPIRV